MIILFIFLGLLPSFVWLGFFLQEDIHPEPRKLIFLVFLGGVIAAIFAVGAQSILQDYFYQENIASSETFSIASFAFIEEFLKFALAFIIIHRSRYFDEPIDAMVYMVSAAAGMGALENLGIMFGDFVTPEKMGILTLRFLGATLLHIMSSALVGFYWARGILKKRRFIYIIFGLILATALHAYFNYLLIVFNGVLIYSILLLIIAAVLVFYDFEKLKKIHVPRKFED